MTGSQQVATLEQLAHKMRGTAGTVGFPTMSTIAGRMERLASKELTIGSALSSEFREEIEGMMEVLGEEIGASQSDSPP